MNRERAKALLPIIQAFSEGKTIQWLTGSGEWYDVVGNDTIDFEFLADRKTKYRIKPEIKDGDILYATDWISGYIYINKGSYPVDMCYCYKLTGGGYLHICNLENPYDCTLPSIAIKEKETRFATESEKQQLFDALAKENKRWDAEKKAIVDLPKDTDLRSTQSKYHIKPEPKCRPFKNAEECWNEMKKHQPFGWLKDKDSELRNIQALTEKMSTIADEVYLRGINLINGWHVFEEAVKEYTFADGTLFGILEEE